MFRFKLNVIILVLLSVHSTCALANNDDDVFLDKKEPTLEQQFIESNKEISNWFDSVTEGVDLFLVGEKVTTERNKSSFRIENTTTTKETENFGNTTSISFHPRLQNLEQYFQLKFTDYDEDESGRGVESGYLRKTQRKKNYGATVGLFRKVGQVRTAFQPRIELQDPLNVSHSLSFESVLETESRIEINPKIEFFASATRGTGIFQAINFRKKLTTIYSATLINEFEYEEKSHKFSATNGLAFGHVLTAKTSLTYSWLFKSLNQPVYHLKEHTLGVTWSQLIYKNILDYQITPYLEFDKNNRFKGIAGVILNISINF